MEDDEITDSAYAFRVTSKDKEWLNKELKDIKALVNKHRPHGTRIINKNDIIMDALRIGFERIKKSKGK